MLVFLVRVISGAVPRTFVRCGVSTNDIFTMTLIVSRDVTDRARWRYAISISISVQLKRYHTNEIMIHWSLNDWVRRIESVGVHIVGRMKRVFLESVRNYLHKKIKWNPHSVWSLVLSVCHVWKLLRKDYRWMHPVFLDFYVSLDSLLF